MQTYEDEETEECRPCSRAGGLLLAGLGAALLFMGADLVSGGRLTGVLFGAARLQPVTSTSDNVDGDQDQPDDGGSGDD